MSLYSKIKIGKVTCVFLQIFVTCYMTDETVKKRYRTHQRAHLVEVWVSGDVVAPLLGADAALAARPGVADPHSLERGRHSPSRVARGTGEDPPHPARCRAPAQRQSGSSWEGVHAACRQPGNRDTTRTSQSNPAGGSSHLPAH